MVTQIQCLSQTHHLVTYNEPSLIISARGVGYLIAWPLTATTTTTQQTSTCGLYSLHASFEPPTYLMLSTVLHPHTRSMTSSPPMAYSAASTLYSPSPPTPTPVVQQASASYPAAAEPYATFNQELQCLGFILLLHLAYRVGLKLYNQASSIFHLVSRYWKPVALPED